MQSLDDVKQPVMPNCKPHNRNDRRNTACRPLKEHIAGNNSSDGMLALSVSTLSPSSAPEGQMEKGGEKKNYGTRDSRMVTHCSTNLAIPCLTRAERTGSRVFKVL